LLLVTLLTGCVSAELAPPRLIAREGAASRRTIRRVVALPATCGGMINAELMNQGDPAYTPGMCTQQVLQGADQAIRSALEFQGLTVIDSEKVNAVTASVARARRGGRRRALHFREGDRQARAGARVLGRDRPLRRDGRLVGLA